MNRHYIWPHRFELCIQTFLCSSIKRKTKKSPVIFKGIAVSAITLHIPCVLYTAGSHVCLWVDRKSRLMESQTFYRIFFYLTSYAFLHKKWACWEWFIKFLTYQNIHFIISPWFFERVFSLDNQWLITQLIYYSFISIIFFSF